MAFDNSDSDSISSINVTPLVDVMLVLLVIFMVTAPILQQGVQLELPKETLEAIEGDTEQLVVSINKQGEVFIGEGNKTTLEELSTKVSAVISQREDKRVFIKADGGVIYDKVMDVIGTLKKGGVSKVGLVTQPE